MITQINPLKRRKVTVVSPQVAPSIYVPEKYTKTFVQSPIPKMPTGIVLSGIAQKAPEGVTVGTPTTGKTVIVSPTIGSSTGSKKVIVGQILGTPTAGKTVIVSPTVRTPTVIIGSTVGNTPVPSKIVLSGAVRKAPEGVIVGNTLEKQGLRNINGNIVPATDLQTISWSDTLKKDAEARAAKGDIVSKIYLATDDPTVVGSAAWMEKQITSGLKSVGIKEEQYGSSGGPTTGNVVGDFLVEGVKGALLDFVPGTIRVLSAGAQGINLLKEVPLTSSDEVLSSLKGGAGNVVTGMIEAATTNPGRFVGGVVPGLLTGKLISGGVKAIPKVTKITGTLPKGATIITKGITAGKSAGKNLVKGVDDILTSKKVGVGKLTRGAEAYIKKQSTGEQWAVTYRLAAGEKIDLAAAKRIVTEYRENPPIPAYKTANVKYKDVPTVSTKPISALTPEILDYIKKLPTNEQNHLLSRYDLGMDFTLNEAKSLVNQLRKSKKYTIYAEKTSSITKGKTSPVKPISALTPEILDYIKKLPTNEQNYLLSRYDRGMDITLNEAKGLINQLHTLDTVKKLTTGAIEEVTIDNILKNTNKIVDVKLRLTEKIQKIGSVARTKATTTRAKVTKTATTLKKKVTRKKIAPAAAVVKTANRKIKVKRKTKNGAILAKSQKAGSGSTRFVSEWEPTKAGVIKTTSALTPEILDYIKKLPTNEQKYLLSRYDRGMDFTLNEAKSLVNQLRKSEIPTIYAEKTSGITKSKTSTIKETRTKDGTAPARLKKTRETATDAGVEVPQKNGMVMLQKVKLVSKIESKQKSAVSVKTAPAKQKIKVKRKTETLKERPMLRTTPNMSGLVRINPGQGFPTLLTTASVVRKLNKIPLDVVDLSLAIAMILGTPAKQKSMYDRGIAINTARTQNSGTSLKVTPDTTQNLGSEEISESRNDVAQLQAPITLSGMDQGLTQIQTQILLTKPRLVERPKPRKPPLPKVPKKPTKRIKPSLEKNEETPKKKTKKVKKIKRKYTQLVNPIPWLMDEGEDLSWMSRDLKKLSIPK